MWNNISAFILVPPPQSLHKQTRQALKQETALAMMMNVITSKAAFLSSVKT